MRADQQQRASPYQGLAPFTEHDRSWFFGREAQVRIVGRNLVGSRLTVLYGGSGVGKTSLLRAGVLTAVRREARREAGSERHPGFAVAVHNRWQDEQPMSSLLASVRQGVAAAFNGDGDLSDIDDDTHLDLVLARYSDAIDADLFLILDQFEEWFLYHGDDKGDGSVFEQVVRSLGNVDIPVHYLISIREDALARLDGFKGRVPGLFENLLRLHHLDRQGGEAAITGPLDRYGELYGEDIRADSRVVERVLDEVRTGAVVLGERGEGMVSTVSSAHRRDRIEAPFLQLVMARLWERERAEGSSRLRVATLEELGGADRIVRTHLDQSLETLTPQQQSLAADVFNHLVTPSGTKIAHSVEDLADYTGTQAEQLEPLVEDLARMRITRPVAPLPGREHGQRVEIFHDVLAPSVLDWRTRQLYERSRERLAREIRSRHRRLAIAAVAGLLALAAVTVLAVLYAREASRANDQSKAELLAANAVALLPSNPARAVRVALRAVSTAGTSTSVTALRTVAPAFLRLQKVLNGDPEPNLVGFGAGGTIVSAGVTRSGDGQALVWNAGTGRRILTISTLDPTLNNPTHVALSDNGRYLAVVRSAHLVEIRRLPSRGVEATIRQPTPIEGVALSPDGRRIATWSNTGFIVWRNTGRKIASTSVSDLADVALRSAGALVATLSTSAGAEAWRVTADGAQSPPVTLMTPGQVKSVGLPATIRIGRLVPESGVPQRFLIQGTAAVALAGTGLKPAKLRGNTAAINSASLDSKGTLAVTSSEDGITRIYRPSDGTLRATLATVAGSVNDAIFSPDGALVATAGNDGRARIWNASLGVPGVQLAGDSGAILSLAFNRGGTRLVTASSDHTVRVWSIAPDVKATTRGQALDARASPGGQVVGVANSISGASMWRPPGIHTTKLDQTPSNGIAFSPNGQYVVNVTRVPGTPSVAGVRTLSGIRLREYAFSKLIPVYHHPSFSPNSHAIVLATGDGARIWTWRNKPGSLSRPFGGSPAGPLGAAFVAEYRPTGGLIATGAENGEVHLTNPKTLANLHTLHLGRAGIVALAFNAKGTLLAAGGGGTGLIGVWSLKPRPHLLAHFAIPAIPTDLSFSSNGDRLVVGATDGTVRVWAWRVPQELSSVILHAGATRAAQYVPGGRGAILSTGDDGVISIWHCQTCVPLASLERLVRRHQQELAAIERASG